MVGTLEQGLADMARRRVTDDLDEVDRATLGASLRIDIPWTDPVAMRKIGAGLAPSNSRRRHSERAAGEGGNG